MLIISGGKGTGKTRALMDRAKLEDGIFVCENPQIMRDRAHKYSITGLNIVSYMELFEGRVKVNDKPLFIHDINQFIKYTFPEVKGYSVCTK